MTYHAIAQLCSSQARVALNKIEHARAIGATEPLACERHVHAWSAVVTAPTADPAYGAAEHARRPTAAGEAPPAASPLPAAAAAAVSISIEGRELALLASRHATWLMISTV